MSQLKENWWADWRFWVGSVISGIVIYLVDKVVPG
jgi:hypothetical protein